MSVIGIKSLISTVGVVLFGGGGYMYYNSKHPSVVDLMTGKDQTFEFNSAHLAELAGAVVGCWIFLAILGWLFNNRDGKSFVGCFTSVIKDMIYTCIALVAMIIIVALSTPVFSTGFVFNGPRLSPPPALAPWFDMHRAVYLANTGPLEAMTLLALASAVVGWTCMVISQTLTYLSLVSATLAKLPLFLVRVLALIQAIVLFFPSIVITVSWFAWLFVIITGDKGEFISDIFAFTEKTVKLIEDNDVIKPALLSKMVYASFGKLF